MSIKHAANYLCYWPQRTTIAGNSRRSMVRKGEPKKPMPHADCHNHETGVVRPFLFVI